MFSTKVQVNIWGGGGELSDKTTKEKEMFQAEIFLCTENID